MQKIHVYHSQTATPARFGKCVRMDFAQFVAECLAKNEPAVIKLDGVGQWPVTRAWRRIESRSGHATVDLDAIQATCSSLVAPVLHAADICADADLQGYADMEVGQYVQNVLRAHAGQRLSKCDALKAPTRPEPYLKDWHFQLDFDSSHPALQRLRQSLSRTSDKAKEEKEAQRGKEKEEKEKREVAECEERNASTASPPSTDTPLRCHESFYQPPSFLLYDWLNAYCAVRKRNATDDYRFVYLGPTGSFTPLHCDVLGSYSWSTNIAGKKFWRLYPPSQTAALLARADGNTDVRDIDHDGAKLS